jgi:hypothetical protein
MTSRVGLMWLLIDVGQHFDFADIVIRASRRSLSRAMSRALVGV